MALTHADDVVTVEDEVGVPITGRYLGLRGDRHRTVTPEQVHPLILEAARDQHSVSHRVSASTIFVRAGSSIESCGRHVCDHSARISANDDGPPTFLGTAFGPVEIVAIDNDIAEAHTGVRQHGERDRRFPGPVRSSDDHGSLSLTPAVTSRLRAGRATALGRWLR